MATTKILIDVRTVGAKKTQDSLNKTKKASKGVVDQNSKVRESFRSTARSVAAFQGPLGPVAGRLNAIGELLSNTTVKLALFGAALTTTAIGLFKSVTAAANLERELGKVDAVLKATGRSTEFTVEEIDKFAIQLGKATLTSATEVRKAASALLQFGDIGRDQFFQVLTVAQDLSETFGTSLQTEVRNLGRAFEDPIRAMSTLSRRGLNLTKEQEQLVRQFVDTGQNAKALAIFLGELGTGAAVGAAQGLTGALDTLGENVTRFFELLGTKAGLLDTVTSAVKALADGVNFLNENMDTIVSTMKTVVTILKNLLFAKVLVGIFGALTGVTASYGAAAKLAAIGSKALALGLNLIKGSLAFLVSPVALTAAGLIALKEIMELLGIDIGPLFSSVLGFIGDKLQDLKKFLDPVIDSLGRFVEKMKQAINPTTALEKSLKEQLSAMKEQTEAQDKAIKLAEINKERQRIRSPGEITGAFPGTLGKFFNDLDRQIDVAAVRLNTLRIEGEPGLANANRILKQNEERVKLQRELTKLANEAGLKPQERLQLEEDLNEKLRDRFDRERALNRELDLRSRLFGEMQTDAQNFADALGEGFKEAKSLMQDFFETGRFELNSFLNLIQRVAARIVSSQVENALVGLFGNTFTSFFGGGGIPARANGGPVSGSGPVLVGERGPELFIPSSAGRIATNGSFGRGGSGGNVNINIVNNTGAGVDTKTTRRADGSKDIEILIDESVGRQIRRPGSQSNSAIQQTFGLQPQAVGR